MEVIVVVYAAFGLTVSEAKADTMCLRAKGMPESTATFSVEAAGQVYNQTNEFVYLRRNVNHNADLSIEVDRRIRNAWCSFRKYTLELYGCTTRRRSLYTSGETSTTTPTCPSRSTGAYATHGAASGSTPSNCTNDRALPSGSKYGC